MNLAIDQAVSIAATVTSLESKPRAELVEYVTQLNNDLQAELQRYRQRAATQFGIGEIPPNGVNEELCKVVTAVYAQSLSKDQLLGLITKVLMTRHMMRNYFESFLNPGSVY